MHEKTSGRLFAKAISANVGTVMLQGCLTVMNLGAASILQAPATQVSFQIILGLIELAKGVVAGSAQALLCEDPQMSSFTRHSLAGTGLEHLGRKRMRARL